jgi:hypothetical protein
MFQGTMVRFDHYWLKSNPSRPFSKCSDDGIGFLFPGRPIFLTFGKFPTVKRNWNPFVLPLLLEDCAQGEVTGIGSKDKWMVWFDLEDLETLFQCNFEIFESKSTCVVPDHRF